MLPVFPEGQAQRGPSAHRDLSCRLLAGGLLPGRARPLSQGSADPVCKGPEGRYLSLCGRSPPPPERERSPQQCVSERRVPLGVTVRSVFKNRCRQKRPSGRSEPVTARGPAPGSRSRVSPRLVGTAGHCWDQPWGAVSQGFPGAGGSDHWVSGPLSTRPRGPGPLGAVRGAVLSHGASEPL